MTNRTLYLIRHGQYDASYGPANDSGLTLLGRQQAALTGQALSTLAFNAIYASSLRRAYETARIIGESFPGLDIQYTDELREVVPIIPPRYVDVFAQYMPNLTEDGIAHDRAQADRAFDRFFAADSGDGEIQDLIICHGNLIQYLICRVLEAPIENWLHLDTNHCGITRVIVNSTSVRKLVSFNDIGHLPPDMRTIC